MNLLFIQLVKHDYKNWDFLHDFEGEARFGKNVILRMVFIEFKIELPQPEVSLIDPPLNKQQWM